MKAKPSVNAMLDSMNLRPMMIAPHYEGLAAALQELADVDVSLEEAAWEFRKQELTANYGLGEAQNGKPFAFSNGVAVIPVHGVLVNRFSHSWGFATGYNFIRSQYKAALADDDVNLIVFDCNSYGGTVAGCFETADEIFKGRDTKPSLAVVDASAYSACYAIGSAASKMVVTPSGGVGSIGVVAMHMNIGGLLDKMGVEVTFIHAGKHKVDGHPFAALPDDVKKTIQTGINKSYATFVNKVSAHRNLSAQVVKDTEARTYDADEALTIGLIDAVQTPSEAVAAYMNELSGSETSQENMMTQQTTQPGAEGTTQAATQAPAVDEKAIASNASKVERERIAGIMNCDEAKGKAKLANHLALNTDMSVDDAKAVLAAAAAEAKDEGGSGASANHFAAAMDATGNPGVGADHTNGAEDDSGKSRASRILAAQASLTGRKHVTH